MQAHPLVAIVRNTIVLYDANFKAALVKIHHQCKGDSDIQLAQAEIVTTLMYLTKTLPTKGMKHLFL